MEDQGYLIFEGIDCVFTREKNNLYLIPKNQSDVYKMHQFSNKKNFLLKYEDKFYKNSYFYIKKIHASFSNYFHFIIKYSFNTIKNYKINGFILTGDDIDIFFNPTGYFYKKYINKISLNTELLYNKEEARKFNFTYLDKNISLSLYYGEILSKGIASDLTLHPKLEIKFEETEDIKYVFKIYEMIIKFLQVVRYQQNYNINPSELIGPTKSNPKSNIGNMYSKFDKYYNQNNQSKYSECDYMIFEPFIENILQSIADNPDYSIRHLPINFEDIYEYDVFRYMSIFSAFENECSQNPEEYKLCDDTNIKQVKDKILFNILRVKYSNVKDTEKNFINESFKNISNLGKQFGQKNKIINAYYKIEECLSSSINNIFFRNQFDINKVANNLSNLRSKIVHDNLYRELKEDEIENIRFLDILTYCLFLKRIGIDNNNIELIIGSIFHCNFKYIDILKTELI